MAPCAHRPPQLRVQGFDGIRHIDDPSHAFGEGEDGNDVFAAPSPAERSRRVSLVPVAALEIFQRLPGRPVLAYIIQHEANRSFAYFRVRELVVVSLIVLHPTQ